MKRFAFVLILCTAALAQPAPPMPPRFFPPEMSAIERGGFLGVGLREIGAERAKALHLKEEAGVEVTGVAPNSPAEKAGLKPGDVVLQYNGTRVEGYEQFSRMVSETPVGREAKLLVFRNGAEQTVPVRIGERSTAYGFGPGNFLAPDVPSITRGMRSPMLGVEVESVSGQFAEYFGVKEGLVVREVTSASPAEKAGLKAGDVILRVDDSKVNSPRDITEKLRAVAGKSVPVAVLRDHKETTLTVEVPERRLGRGIPTRFVTVNDEGN